MELYIVEGSIIRVVYDHPNITSSLSGHPTIDWYVENPQAVKMLLALDENNVPLGRALLWQTDQGVTVMDNIYCNQRRDVMNAMTKWAVQNKAEYVARWPRNKSPFYSVTLNLPTALGETNVPWPYLDVFQYCHVTLDDLVVISTMPTEETTMVLNSHDGEFQLYHRIDAMAVEAYQYLQRLYKSGIHTPESVEELMSYIEAGYVPPYEDDDVELSSAHTPTETPTHTEHNAPPKLGAAIA